MSESGSSESGAPKRAARSDSKSNRPFHEASPSGVPAKIPPGVPSGLGFPASGKYYQAAGYSVVNERYAAPTKVWRPMNLPQTKVPIIENNELVELTVKMRKVTQRMPWWNPEQHKFLLENGYNEDNIRTIFEIYLDARQASLESMHYEYFDSMRTVKQINDNVCVFEWFLDGKEVRNHDPKMCTRTGNASQRAQILQAGNACEMCGSDLRYPTHDILRCMLMACKDPRCQGKMSYICGGPTSCTNRCVWGMQDRTHSNKQ